ncbi:MAG: HD domain-containing protein [Anaerolineales bacterium]|nr:HD domain-containing protein [Anaerolineales bacterium]
MQENITKFFNTKSANPEFEGEIIEHLGAEILATNVMDRLRKISMMGLVYIFWKIPNQYVFSRYDHTLAVTHLTLQLCKKLKISKFETQLAMLGALCHDLGHGPLSHSSEGYLLLKSGGRGSHQRGNHFYKIAAMLEECETTLQDKLGNKIPDREKLAKVIYYITQGVQPPEENLSGTTISNEVIEMFNSPLSPDVIDGENRAFLSLGQIEKLQLSPCDPEALINAISDYDEVLVVDGVYGRRLLNDFATLQEKFYKHVIQTKRLETGEAMLVRAIELAFPGAGRISYSDRKGFSNLTDQDLIAAFTDDPNSKSAKLWGDINSQRLFARLSDIHPELYRWANEVFPIRSIGQRNFKFAKKSFEQRLAKKLGEDADYVIVQIVEPLNWKKENVIFIPLNFIGPRTATRWKVRWDSTQGISRSEDKRLEIYVPLT